MNLKSKLQVFVAAAPVLGAAKVFSDTPEPGTSTVSATMSKSVCLTELNEARGAVGLLKFEPPEALRTLEKLAPENENVKDDPVWGPVCTVLLQAEQPQLRLNVPGLPLDGSVAFRVLEDATPNCRDAVDAWKDGFIAFPELPPVYSSAAGPPYDNPVNAAFIAIYNPGQSPTADCRVITCTENTVKEPEKDEDEQERQETAEGDDENPQDEDEEQKEGRDGEQRGDLPSQEVEVEETGKGFALVCLTAPQALIEGQAPFTEEQWGAITAGFTESATSFPQPAFFLLAAAALGLSAV